MYSFGFGELEIPSRVSHQLVYRTGKWQEWGLGVRLPLQLLRGATEHLNICSLIRFFDRAGLLVTTVVLTSGQAQLHIEALRFSVFRLAATPAAWV